MAGRVLLLCACLCRVAFGADDQPLLSIEIFDQLGTKLVGDAEIELVAAKSGEDYGAKLSGHQGRVPEGAYRMRVEATGFNSYEETIQVTAPNTVVRVGLVVGDIGNYGSDRPRRTTALISGYVDSELSKGRDLWVQVYPVFRPQEPGRIARIRRDGHFEISVPVDLDPWVLVVVEMLPGSFEELPKNERFPFPKIVGSRVVHTSDMPVKIALQ